MLFWTLSVISSWLLDILAVARLTGSEQDLELLILRHQDSILERQVNRPRVSRLEKLSLAVIVNKLKQQAQSILIFTPETVLGWHREETIKKCGVRHEDVFDSCYNRGYRDVTRRSAAGILPGHA